MKNLFLLSISLIFLTDAYGSNSNIESALNKNLIIAENYNKLKGEHMGIDYENQREQGENLILEKFNELAKNKGLNDVNATWKQQDKYINQAIGKSTHELVINFNGKQFIGQFTDEEILNLSEQADDGKVLNKIEQLINQLLLTRNPGSR